MRLEQTGMNLGLPPACRARDAGQQKWKFAVSSLPSRDAVLPPARVAAPPRG